MARKKVTVKTTKRKVIAKKEKVITNWMVRFAIILMVPTGAASYRVGKLSSQTYTLERTAGKHEMRIGELSSTIKTLQAETRIRYPAIKLDIAGLKRQIGTLRRETDEHVRTMRNKITTLHHDVLTSLNKVILLSN